MNQSKQILDDLNHLATTGQLTNVVSRQAIEQARQLVKQDGITALPDIMPPLQLVIKQIESRRCYINPTSWGRLVDLYQQALQAYKDEQQPIEPPKNKPLKQGMNNDQNN